MSVRVLAALAVALLAAGCGTDSKQSIVDGRHFGFIVSADRFKPTIAFDDAEFLSGKEAQQAAEDAGAVAPGEPVSNDYYIVDGDSETVTLPVAKDARVTVVSCPTSCSEGHPGAFDRLETGSDHPPYWVTTEDGVVTKIDQQYVP
jgi:hypothetical protein